MDTNNSKARLAELDKQITSLPRGSISTKKVNGHMYFYHRWYEGKTKKEQFIPEEDLEQLRSQIEQRKELEAQRKELKKQLPKPPKKQFEDTADFITVVRRGSSLKALTESVRSYRKRECFAQLYDYIFGSRVEKVLVLYGLRRTGKTTMIRQILN